MTLIELQNAVDQGKQLQKLSSYDKWEDTDWNYTKRYYTIEGILGGKIRIKPTEVDQPFTVETIPYISWLVHKNDHSKGLHCYYNILKIDMEGVHIIYSGTPRRLSYTELFDGYKYTYEPIPNKIGVVWKDCSIKTQS
jgi:hypothetical protein